MYVQRAMTMSFLKQVTRTAYSFPDVVSAGLPATGSLLSLLGGANLMHPGIVFASFMVMLHWRAILIL